MPMIDMTLGKLKEYKGINEKPKDFSDFWDKRVNEANHINLEYKIKNYDEFKNTECYFQEIEFKGVSGEVIYAKYLRPKVNYKTPLILQFHGYPGASRGWFEQCSFVGMGCSIIAMDCPGQGGNSFDIGNYKGSTVSGHIILGLDGDPKEMYYVKLFQNTIILCRIAEQLDEIDKNKIYANGASQGGAIALACAALNKSIKKCGVLYPFLSDFKRVWDMDLDQVAYEGLRYYSKWFDPMGLREEEIFSKLGYIDIHNFADRIESEVLFGTGLMDNICPPSTQFAIFNNLNCKKKHLVFPDYSHEEISEFDDNLIEFFAIKE